MSDVIHRTRFQLIDRRRDPRDSTVSVPVTLSWSPDSPFQVALCFEMKRGPTVWIVSRDLLIAGLDGPAGLGDVAVMPDLGDGRWLELILDSPAGRVGLRVFRQVLAKFLGLTLDVAQVGAEVMPVNWADGLVA